MAVILSGCTSVQELAGAVQDRQVDNLCDRPEYVFPDAWDNVPRVTPGGNVWMIRCTPKGDR